MKHQRREAGYTLVEILTATAVFAVVMVAALLVYDRSNRVFKEGIESSNLQQNTRVAFDRLVAELRMTGFDFDRDGVPVGTTGGTNQYQQPDEQFEYIGPAAITIRGNLDYEHESQPCPDVDPDNCDFGREVTHESSYFPVVTTGNDEIVTYALVPDSQTTIPSTCDPQTNCVEFYADTHVPRKSYPEPSNGGLDEALVQIKGVDLCYGGCNNPPYTLYRFTLSRENNPTVNRIPIASNIRSMSFTYYQDTQASTLLRDIANTTNVNSAAIRGLGRFEVANPTALLTEKEIRSKIRAVRVELTGMNEAIDRSFTDTTPMNVTSTAGVTSTALDTVAPNHRKYRLQTVVAPRNAQRRGMREQDTHPPGAPSWRGEPCTGYCGGVYLEWNAPMVNANQGAPDQYKVIYGPNVSGGGYPCETTTFTQTYTHLFGVGDCALVPNVAYKFRVVALNTYGSQSSPDKVATPLNTTKPNPPVPVSATNNLNGKVTLVWNRPTQNASGAPTCPPTHLPAAEIMGYKVERAAATIEPDPASSLWQMVGSGPVTVSSPLNTVTWTDSTAANCTLYWYRITTVEKCSLDAAYNQGNDISLGSSAPSTAISGNAVSTVKPGTPTTLQVDQTALESDGVNSCIGTDCYAKMIWPKVLVDEAGESITVAEYKVYRRNLGQTTWGAAFATVTNIPAGDDVTYVAGPSSVAGNQQYEFTIAANQCNSLESNLYGSPQLWPCTFPAGVVGTIMLSGPGAFDGGGTAANPWRFFNNAGAASIAVNIQNAAAVQSVKARVYNANGTLKAVLPDATAAGGWTFSWGMASTGTERIDVTVTESGGCTRRESAYVSSMPQGCCLVPNTFDSTVMVFTPGTNVVDIYLKNLCSENLNLFSNFIVTWNSARGGDKIDGIQFFPPSGTTITHSTGGGFNSTPVNVPFPTTTGSSMSGTAGTPAAVPAGSSTYRVRVTFNRNASSNPITGVTVTYRRATSDLSNVACTIVTN